MPLKLSIISPSYNQADFVNQTLRGVSRQDYAEIEHIVQDAGSTDGTLELLRAYAADEKRARVAHSQLTILETVRSSQGSGSGSDSNTSR